MAVNPLKVVLTGRLTKLLKQGDVLVEDDKELDYAVESFVAALDEKGGIDFTSVVNELEIEYDKIAKIESTGDYKCVLDYDTRLGMFLDLLKKMDNSEIIKGQSLYEPPSQDQEKKSKFMLKSNRVPRYIYQHMSNHGAIRSLKLSLILTKANYIEQFQKYLWLEEAYQDIEMQRYAMKNVHLHQHRDYFLLKVPGLEQNRPCLMPNDTLLVSKEDSNTIFQGYIHQVRANDVLIKLNRELHKLKNSLNNQSFNITFQPSRTSFKWLHHGVTQFLHREDNLSSIVFPEINENPNKFPMVESEVKNFETVWQLDQVRKGLNKNQLKAVVGVLNAKNRPSPYLIHGCPGGGKSRVVVEIVHQVYSRRPDFNILVCGNSNSCADLLAERLLKPENLVSTNHIVRIASLNRLEQPITAELMPIMKSFDELKVDTLRNLRIIVTTCIKAGSLNSFPDLKFDYVIVDEAGHASEPETLIPIGLLKENGCAVLVGDWFQLGPLCLSAIAKKNILGTSLLERLASMWMYRRNEQSGLYNSNYITKLKDSYRSDPRVLAVNNELFYESELDCKVTTPPLLLKHMKVSQPIVFLPVPTGKEKKKKHSPSFYNPTELFVCLRLVQHLYKYKTKSSSFSPSNVGIVTPYTLQIEQLNFYFDRLRIPKCKIGTVENYQGDERDIIIISTVRTLDKNVDSEMQRNKFQFLFQPKRFNVATSRAKFMTILVGDPKSLNMDPNWSEFIKRAEVSNFDTFKNKRKPAK